MEQKVKDALDNMLQKLKDLNIESGVARLKIIEGIEKILKEHNKETKEEVFKKVESLLKD